MVLHGTIDSKKELSFLRVLLTEIKDLSCIFVNTCIHSTPLHPPTQVSSIINSQIKVMKLIIKNKAVGKIPKRFLFSAQNHNTDRSIIQKQHELKDNLLDTMCNVFTHQGNTFINQPTSQIFSEGTLVHPTLFECILIFFFFSFNIYTQKYIAIIKMGVA